MEREDIRIRVAGIYIQDQKILLVKHRKFNQEYYLLPGGGQQTGENAKETLVREWKEELDIDAIPGEFLFLGESIPPDINERRHVYQFVFSVIGITGNINVHPDNTLIGCAWINLDELPDIKLYPQCTQQILAYIHKLKPELYIGYKWV